MARIFRLGDFFGITAAQLLLFKPEHFTDLLKYSYNSQANESLYSLIREMDFLRKALTVDSMKPDYDSLTYDFKVFGYLGLSKDSSDGKAMMKIASFYRDSVNMTDEELVLKYGYQAEEILGMIKDTLTIDVPSAFPDIMPEAIPVVQSMYNDKEYLKKIQSKCKELYENSSFHEKKVSGRPIREIIELDRNSGEGNKACCRFVSQMYSRLRTASSKIDIELALKEIEHDISNIQKEYDAKDVVFTDATTVVSTLRIVYSEMSVDSLNSILFGEDTGKYYTREKYNKVFSNLDSFGIGGLGFNSVDMGEKLVSSLSDDYDVVTVSNKREHNEKLDAILSIAYADLRSRQALMSI